MLPPVRIKLLFGEFQARPEPGNPGFLDLDPAWVKQNIDTQHVPLLGTVTCNVSLFPQLRGVVHELIDRGLQDTIHSYSGCYSPRHINRIPSAGLSHHSWGIAVDLNVQQGNLFGQTRTRTRGSSTCSSGGGSCGAGRSSSPTGCTSSTGANPPDA